jgi:hypothetical protein
MSFQPASFTDVRRSGPPTTDNGSEWTIPISVQPANEWLELFKKATGEDSSVGVAWAPNSRVITLRFASTPDKVPQSLESIDRWIARANDQYRSWLNEAHRKGNERRRDQQTEADRVRGLNERFKNL